MRVRIIAALLIFALAPTLAVADPKPPAPIMQLANAVLAGADANDASAFAGLFTGDAVVVDENAPFEWRGPSAGVAWWHVVDAVTHKAKIVHLKAVGVHVSEFKQSEAGAYLIEAMTVTGIAAGKPFAERGTMTYTFRNAGGKWLISTMVWTKKP